MIRFTINILFILTNLLYSGTFSFKEFPDEKQFFPRDSSDSFTIKISGNYNGKIVETDLISVILFEKETELLNIKSPLTSTFNFNVEIPAKMFSYRCDFYLNDSLINSSNDLTCGDVIIVYGQSNAHGGYAIPSLFIKSYGYKDTSRVDSINAKLCQQDTLWKTNSVRIGASWKQLAQELQRQENIPFCVINGAYGGREINFFLPDTLDKTNLLTSYGRLLYRIKKANLQDAVKTIIWHQGESDANMYYGPKYNKNFDKLYKGLKFDFSKLQRIYLYQIGIGCGSTNYSAQFREIQRKIPQRYSDIQIMNTVGYIYHGETDKCHYVQNGYVQLGNWLVDAYEHDIYQHMYDIGIYPPNIKSAFFTSENKNQVALEFDQTIIFPKEKLPDKIENYFYFGTDSFLVDSGFVHENGFTLLLNLHEKPKTDSVSYLPQKFYNSTKTVYEGPWLTNVKGLGALSFFDFSINDTGTVKDATLITSRPNKKIMGNEMQVYPNPTNASVIVSFELVESGFYNLQIFDVLGKVKNLFKNKYMNIGKTALSIDLKDYASGNYFLKFYSINSNLVTKQILIVK